MIYAAIVILLAFGALAIFMVISPQRFIEWNYRSDHPFRGYVLQRFKATPRGIEWRICGIVMLLMILRIAVPLLERVLRR
jgi:hypothetical protein